MGRSAEDDQEAVNRAFASLVAGYHLTAECPGAETSGEPPETREQTSPSAPFFMDLPARDLGAPPRAESDRYEPEPLPPLRRPGLAALLGWIGVGYAAVLVLLGAFGVPVPGWAGQLAVVTFLVGFGLLVTRLPRHRPPDAGDGAVV